MNVRKLYYLKQALIRSAQLLVRDFELSDTAYAEAWSYVISRFDNKRLVVRALFKRLINLEPIKVESKIRSILDKLDIIVRGLKAAGEKVDDIFSRFIVYFASLRLDPKTLRDWESSVTTFEKFSELAEFRKFLQVRCFTLEDQLTEAKLTMKLEKSQFTSKPPTKGAKSSFLVSNKEKCISCSKEHALPSCKEFLALTPQQRYDFAKEKRLCISASS